MVVSDLAGTLGGDDCRCLVLICGGVSGGQCCPVFRRKSSTRAIEAPGGSLAHILPASDIELGDGVRHLRPSAGPCSRLPSLPGNLERRVSAAGRTMAAPL